MSFRQSEVQRVLEESQFNDSQQSIPLGGGGNKGPQDHRFSFNIGAFSDGMRSSFCIYFSFHNFHLGLRRILSQNDETVFGIQKNSLEQLRRYFTHNHIFFVNNKAYDAQVAYEYDYKQYKFVSKEKSLIFKVGPADSNWKLKFDGTQRKNLIDRFSSKEYLRDDIMLSYKQSIGLEYFSTSEDSYKKLDFEVALPDGLGHHHGMPSFVKLDGFLAKTYSIIPQKLKFTSQVQGGLIRPIFGSKKTTINDRFFITSSLGYSHLGHTYPSNNEVEIIQEENKPYIKKYVGDDLGSENYLLLQGKLEFLDILGIRSLGLRTFTFVEAAFYPQLDNRENFLNKILKSTRLSAGFGLAIPLNPQISIMLYYNAINFNSRKGDYERKGYLNVNIGFF